MLAHTQSTLDKTDKCELPGQSLNPDKMPGHWLLARLGKRVLRPGGLELTRKMLAGLRPGPSDHVVEFAPGLGVTARMVLASLPASYTAVERDESAAAQVRRWLPANHSGNKVAYRVIQGLAQETGLQDGCATVVYGEAMLTMQSESLKRQIIREAFRLLQSGGRYGIHELCLSENLPAGQADAIRRDITDAIHHRALPLSIAEWEAIFRSEGFEVLHRADAPMALLEPARMIRDEGIRGAARFLWRLLRDPQARQRVKTMRRVFRKHQNQMAAVCLILRKPRA